MSIKIEHLTKSFGGVVAVDDLTLAVPDGEMLVLLGPFGLRQDHDHALHRRPGAAGSRGDRDRQAAPCSTADKLNVPINQRNVGMVFQSYAIWPHMSVFDNVAFPLRVKNLAARRDRDTGRRNARPRSASPNCRRAAPATLSGGQMQRVALARSLVMRPSALLFDEPLSNLDARLRDRLRIQLRELQTQFSITSVYVTHDQHEALALADQIAVMHHGGLLQVADPVSIYSQPTSSTVADFLGYSNIFRIGATKRVDGGVEVMFEGSRTTLLAACAARDPAICSPASGPRTSRSLDTRTMARRAANTLTGEVYARELHGIVHAVPGADRYRRHLRGRSAARSRARSNSARGCRCSLRRKRSTCCRAVSHERSERSAWSGRCVRGVISALLFVVLGVLVVVPLVMVI